MTRAFTDDEAGRIGWAAAIDLPRAHDKPCHLCQNYCFRDAEKTRIGATGAFGHLEPCCRVLENTGGSVMKTDYAGRCSHWERRK